MTLSRKVMWALICGVGVDPFLCGVYSSKKEAQEVADAVKDCPLKHLVKKCSVVVEC